MAATANNSRELTVKLMRELALAEGFSEAGLVALPHAEEARDAGRFREWAVSGRAGTMHYLARAAESGQLLRERVSIPFPWARSALVCFASYNFRAPLSIDESERGSAWIARYAWSGRRDAGGELRPSDYHRVLLKRMRKLEAELHARLGEFESRTYVDTGPVVERVLAAAAGVGWIGKNTCVIHPKLGSFGFLAVLVTELEVSEETREQGSEGASQRVSKSASQRVRRPVALELPDRCGSCTRCIEACPTNALTAPYQMDASRCISYLTIEHKGPIAEDLMGSMGRQVFGCDICQDVCPWNRRAIRIESNVPQPTHSAKDAEWMGHKPIAVDAELEPRAELVNPALDWLGSLDEKSFERVFNGSPVRRTGFAGLRRNVAIAMGNSGLARFATQLEAWAQEADEGLRAAARWALERLSAHRL